MNMHAFSLDARRLRRRHELLPTEELERLVVVSVRSVWRLIIAVVGITILLIGIALLVLPGPGWITVLVGLGILGSEFVWARRALRKLRGELLEYERFVKREVRSL